MQSQPSESIFRLKNGFGPPRCVDVAETSKGGGGTLFITLKNVNRMVDETDKKQMLSNEREEKFELESAETPCYLKSLCTLGSIASLATCGTFGVILMAYKMKEYDRAALLLGAGQVGERRQAIECNKMSGKMFLDVVKFAFICKNIETYAKKATALTRFARWLKKRGKTLNMKEQTFGYGVDPDIEGEFKKVRRDIENDDFSLLCCNLFTPLSGCATQGEILEVLSELPEKVVDLNKAAESRKSDNIIGFWNEPMTLQTMR